MWRESISLPDDGEGGGTAKVDAFWVAHKEVVYVSLWLTVHGTVGSRCCPCKTDVPSLFHPPQLILGPQGIWRIHMLFLLGTGDWVTEESRSPLSLGSPHHSISPPFFPSDLKAQGRSLAGVLVTKTFSWSDNCQPPLQDIVGILKKITLRGSPVLKWFFLFLVRRQSLN